MGFYDIWVKFLDRNLFEFYKFIDLLFCCFIDNYKTKTKTKKINNQKSEY